MHNLPVVALVFTAASSLAIAHSTDSVRDDIAEFYESALEAARNAKSMADLDEINRTFDTQDWQSISPGQQPTDWQTV